MTDAEALAAQIAALEERVGALEARDRIGPSAVDPPAPAVDADGFWALEGLHRRVSEPGAVMIVGDVVLPEDRRARWQQGAATDDLLDDEWDHLADVFAALGHPVRLQLLRHVLRGVDSARALADIDGIGTSGQVYHHLRQLVAAGWLRNRGARFEVPPERVVPLLSTIVGGRR